MKKEYLIVFAAFLFILSYILDFLAGVVNLTLPSPGSFLDPTYLNIYPLTAAEIGIRSFAYILTVLLALDGLIGDKYFQRAAVVAATGGLSIAYAIQQMATGGTLTPFQWTLAFAYGGLGLLPFTVYYIIRGILKGIYTGLGGGNNDQVEEEDEEEDSEN